MLVEARELLTPEAYSAAQRHHPHRDWAAIPSWGLVRDLDAQLSSFAEEFGTWAVRDAYLASFVSTVARLARPLLSGQPGGVGGPISDREAWDATIGAAAPGMPWGSDRLTARLEGLAEVHVRAARLLHIRLRDPEVTARGRVTHARVLGDMHVRGATTLLYVDGRPSLVYKPRSLASDVLLAATMQTLAAHPTRPELPDHPRSFDRGSHGFQEYVAYSSPEPGPARAAFYRRYGALIAVAYAVRLTDLHFENVLVTASGPVIMDAECLLSFPFGTAAHSRSSIFHGSRLSVLDSSLLPSWKATPDGVRDTSALGRYAHPDRVAGLDGSEHGSGVGPHAPSPSLGNQPDEELGVFPAWEHRDEIAAGFEAAYRALMAPATTTELLRLVEGARDLRSRLVTADTEVYVTRLQATDAPDPVPDAGASTPSAAIVEGERFALARGLVPLFERDVRTGDLLLEAGGVVPIGGGSPLTAFAAHLAELSEADLVLQTEILLTSLEVGRANPSDGGRPAAPASSSAGASGLPQRIGDLADHVLEAFDEARFPWMLSTVEIEPDHVSLRIARQGLYAGHAGLLYALGIAGIGDARLRRRHRGIAETYLDAIDLVDRRGDAHAPLSLTGGGVLGPLVGIATVARATGDPALLDRIASLGRGAWLEGPVSNGIDLVGGSAGAVVALARLAELTGSASYRARLVGVVDRLSRDVARSVGSGRLPVGMAHGLSGAAVAFRAAADALGDETLVDSSRLCLVLEDELLAAGRHGRRETTSSWCWGVAGQLEARLVCGGDPQWTDRLRDSLGARSTDQIGFCHGLAGSALLTGSRRYRERYGDRDHDEGLGWMRSLSDAPSSSLVARRFVVDRGLYTGASGILVLLASLRDSASFSMHDLRYEPGS